VATAELVCLAAAQALLGLHSEHRWIRFAICHVRGCFPCLPDQPGYNKRLRAVLPLVKQVIRELAAGSGFWSGDTWIADSTPVECGRSRPDAKRSDMAGWAGYGYCACHSRWLWGLRRYLICTPAGMPILWALAPRSANVRCWPRCSMSSRSPPPPGQADPDHRSTASPAARPKPTWAAGASPLLRPSRQEEQARHGEPPLKAIRQLIESINDTLKGQLDLQAHGGRTFAGVAIRVAQRILAMAAQETNKPIAQVARELGTASPATASAASCRSSTGCSLRCRQGRRRLSVPEHVVTCLVTKNRTDVRKTSGAKGIRTPGLLHAMQVLLPSRQGLCGSGLQF